MSPGEAGVRSFIRGVRASSSAGSRLSLGSVPPVRGKFVGGSVKGSSIDVDGKETKVSSAGSSDNNWVQSW